MGKMEKGSGLLSPHGGGEKSDAGKGELRTVATCQWWVAAVILPVGLRMQSVEYFTEEGTEAQKVN